MERHDEKWLLEDEVNNYQNDPEFVAEGLALKITEEILRCLEERNLSQSWLAEQMGVSRAHVSRILNAKPNMTLLTIAKIAIALGVKPDVFIDTVHPVRDIACSSRNMTDPGEKPLVKIAKSRLRRVAR